MINKKVSISMSRVHNLFIKSSVVVLATAVFIIGGFSVYRAHAQQATLGVIGQPIFIQSFATADNTYNDGWKWLFNVSVPSNQTLLRMKFADWLNINGYSTIPAGGNMQFYSAQSLNAIDEAHAIPITASSTLSDIMYINPNIIPDNGSRYIQIIVEAKVPVGSAGGSYSNSYGLNSTATSSISFTNLLQTYNSNPLPVTVITDPVGLSTNVIYTGFGTTIYNATTTPPTHAGTYSVNANVTDPNYTGTSTATLVIQQAPVTVTADLKTKVYDGATSTDPVLTYTSIPEPFVGDTFTGSLTRDQGENVGSYNINQGSLALSGDYVLTYSPGSFVITPASASISFSSTTQTYDKTGKSVVVTTTPPGLSNSVTYDGDASLPVNAGTYTTLATITDPNYEGSTSVDLVINKAPLTVTATTSTKVYDASTSSNGLPQITSGQLFSTDTAVWSQSFDTKDVGNNKTLTATGVVSDDNSGGNYAVTFIANNTGSITPATATVTAQGENKVYDGTTDASTTVLTVGGAVGGDSLTANGTSIFINKDVGSGKEVDVTGITISGTNVTALDYTYNTSASTTGDITPAPLTITTNNANKNYGVDLTFAGTEFTTNGLFSGDNVTSVILTSAGAASTSPVASYTIIPSDATGTPLLTTDYNISYVNGNLVVSQKNITATITASNKVYDGTTVATTSACTLNGVSNGDQVSCIVNSATFDNKDVGVNKIVTANVNLDGNNKDNYIVATPVTATATITALPITVSAVNDSKTYDGTASSTGLPTITSGTIASVDTAPIWTQTFNDKNVGNNKIITPAGIVNDGFGGLDYDVSYATTSGEITAKDLTVTATGVNKTYDGTTDASTTLSDNRVAGDDVVDNYATATFTNKDIGSSTQIDVYGITITGTDSGNYHLTNTSASTSADINYAPLTITALPITKVYGDIVTLGATSTGFTDSGLLNGDSIGTVTLSSPGTPVTATVIGSPYDISPSNALGIGLTNYDISYSTSSLTVIPKPIAASIVADSKIYDGTNVASTSCVLANGIIINSDVVSCSTTNATFSSRNAGTWTVTASTTLADSGASNYIANSTASVDNITISKLPITVTASPSTRVYDGSTDSSSTPSVSPAIGVGDVAHFIETYDNRNVGTSTLKVMTPSGNILF